MQNHKLETIRLIQSFKILQGGRYPHQNHLCKFWWWLVKRFGLWSCGGG